MVKNPSKRLFILLATSIFVGELIIMVVFERWLPKTSTKWSAFLDATLLLAITAPLLQQFLIKPITKLVSEFQQAKDKLRVTAQAFETDECIVITDAQLNILQVNKSFEKTTGFKESYVINKPLSSIASKQLMSSFKDEIHHHLSMSGSWNNQTTGLKVDDVEFPIQMSISEARNSEGALTEYIFIFSDITEKKKNEDRIYKLAYYDAATDLPNRELLLIDLEKSLNLSEKTKEYGALILLQSDNFRLLTDSHSFLFGDLFLQKISIRLKREIPSYHSIYKIHGREFAILLENIGKDKQTVLKNVKHIESIIEYIFSTPFKLRDYEHHSTVSAGVALFVQNETTPEELITSAEISLHQASGIEGNSVIFFDKSYREEAEKKSLIEQELHQAVEKQELEFYYQLQLDAHQKPIGAEALVRWHHPTLGLMHPSVFIPIAEESLLIETIGTHLLELGFQRLVEWAKNEKTRHLTLSINVSAKQFYRADFETTLAIFFEQYPINASKLYLELTESIGVADLRYISSKMKMLKEKFGIKLSLDDFGTGYSSLSYLQEMPFDELKIDQAFVKKLNGDTGDGGIVESIIALAKIYKFEVIAEGVETQDQFDCLRSLGCQNFQGYLFSKPVPLNEFEALLDK